MTVTVKYLVITPVKDESRFILKTVRSVIAQTVRPARWVIVDDGSSDDTVEIIRPFLLAHEWIRLVMNGREDKRLTGTAEAAAFKLGLESAKGLDYGLIAKLDGDVVLGKDYFGRLIGEFEKDPGLGISSGCYLEMHGGGWKAVNMPEYHAAGAAKVLRRKCFEDINGFLTVPGWDTVDEIKALYLGWRTRHFRDIRFLHLRNEGSGMGKLVTSMMHGEIFYLTGGGLFFFLLKFIHRAFFSSPFLLGGIMMLCGYAKPMILRKALLVTGEEAMFYRKLLNRRMLHKVRTVLRHRRGRDVRDLRDL